MFANNNGGIDVDVHTRTRRLITFGNPVAPPLVEDGLQEPFYASACGCKRGLGLGCLSAGMEELETPNEFLLV